MRFVLLGPLAVFDGEAELKIQGRLKRAILTTLLLHAGTVVPADTLAQAVWGEDAPDVVSSPLHNHLMRLRKALGETGGARVRTAPAGYLIQVEPGELDLQVFDSLCATARDAMRAERWEVASSSFRAALDLWKGEILRDVPDSTAALAAAERLREARTQARSGRVEADLRLGRAGEAIVELRALIAEQPLREEFHGQLMRALVAEDRRAEALDVYQDVRRKLREELGVDPSAPLRGLHTTILREQREPGTARRTVTAAEPAPRAPAPAASGPAFPQQHAPRQLPNNSGAFVGRERELAHLAELARTAGSTEACETVVLSAIDGMGGVGKTALAVRAAHQASAFFPDGQLFVDLHGHTPGDAGLTAHDALASLLRALGVPGTKIPADTDDRSALYRSQLAGTRTLILLDNAATAAQVRPLIPSSPGSLVIVTSRSTLAGLDDAHFLRLEVLAEPEAIALLHRIAGPGRLAQRHPALRELAALCGGLPLALRIAAAHFRHNRHLDLEDYVAGIRSTADRLRALSDGERNLSAVFDSSYTALSPAEQQLFRMLALVPGFDFDAYVAANLLGTELRTAERLLELLLADNLLVQGSAGRYQLHDLVRAYAKGILEPADRSASARLLDYYEATARRADRLLALHSGAAPSGPEPLVVPDLPDASAAVAWMRTERANLLAAVRAKDTAPERSLALTQALSAFLQQQGPWSEAAQLHSAAVETAAAIGDDRALAHAQWSLGRTRFITGPYQLAAQTLEQAVAAYRRLGDEVAQANALWDLGRALQFTNAPAEAADRYNAALALYRRHGDPVGEAHVLHELARLRYLDADLAAAAELEAQALALYRQTGNRLGQANALLGQSRIRQAQGDTETAARLLDEAMPVYRSLGNALGEANTLIAIGRIRHATGQPAAAAEVYAQALAQYRRIGGRQGEANTLHDLGRVWQDLGRADAAAELFGQAELLFQELKDPHGTAQVLNSTGSLLAATGDLPRALACYRRALEFARDSASHEEEARARDGVRSTLTALEVSGAAPGPAPGPER